MKSDDSLPYFVIGFIILLTFILTVIWVSALVAIIFQTH